MSKQAPRNTVTVRIGGEEHVLRSTAEPAYAKKCAAHVDQRIQEIKKASGIGETNRAVILAALSIADEYFRAQDGVDDLRREVVSRSRNLTKRVEEAIVDRVPST
ncbi:MAG: cell division protein ZapA [Gemmatimonadota bacterium]